MLMSGKRTFVVGALLLGALLVISCDDFYSATWGTAREYDPSKISVNAGNVDEWVEKAAGNPELADAVTEAIKDELKNGNLNTGDKAKLQDAGVALAVEASGIGETILEKAADTLGSGISTAEDLSKLLADVQSDFEKNKGGKAASDIADIISGSLEQPSYGQDGVPKLTGAYVNAADSADVGQAVAVLTLALVGKATSAATDMSAVELSDLAAYGVYINTDKEAAVMVANPSPEAVTLAAYLNLIADDTTGKYSNNPLTATIAIAFGVL
jgi:hypothetical protein